MFLVHPRRALVASAVFACLSPFAQAEPEGGSSQQLPTVLVTGNPLRGDGRGAPANVLAGDALALRRGSSLGDTLEGLPGVSSTWFGPNANRPTLRGLDGDRIRLLSNSGAALDASSLSFDHAVPIDPLVVERLEVLRGPQALLYGGSALGGVVNAIDGRIPQRDAQGLSGAAELRLGGAARERGASALLEGGGAGWAWHADAFRRRTDDLQVPRYERPGDGGATAETRVLNSASQAQGGALGASRVWSQGHLGLSWDQYANDYGVVAEEDILIRMRRARLALAGEWRAENGWTLRGQAARTRYQHEEVEGDGRVGTTFRNRGHDARLELVHPRLGALQGVLGWQGEQARFEALGDEAFVPGTRTRSDALFLVEQLPWGGVQWSAGLRQERVRVDSEGDGAGLDAPRFGPAQRRSFRPRSASAGASWALAPGWQLSASQAWSQRAPTQYELYADGVHAATAAHERGQADQRLERGRQREFGLAWKPAAGAAEVKLSAFDARFAHYIALLRKADEPDFENEAGARFPRYAFEGVRARLRGLELSAQQAWTLDGQRWLLEASHDRVRGDDLRHAEPLPRLAPQRVTLALQWQSGPWTLRGQGTRASAQTRVPADDSATPGWTRFDLALTHRLRLGEQEALLFVKLTNAGNRLAYSASSVAAVRALAPLPGRALSAGLRLVF